MLCFSAWALADLGKDEQTAFSVVILLAPSEAEE